MLLGQCSLYAQYGQTSIHSTSEHIFIDGHIQEDAWQSAELITTFQRYFPSNSGPATYQTQVRLLFDDRFLYIAADCQLPHGGSFVVQSLKRDFEFGENDAFDVYLDAFGDATSGLAFGVNPYGVQRDGIIPDGGVKEVDLTWDSRWHAEVYRRIDGWSVEMAIPFKSLRFKKNQRRWRVNFARHAVGPNEISTWAPIDRGNTLSTLTLMGELIWDQAPPPIQHNIAIVPYAAMKAEKISPEASTPPRAFAGLDAKIGIGSALHLDLTVNPDFSQVEVDQQVINLNRFELFFPERRLFFLENSDLFSHLGNSRIRPFFSRRIGSLNQQPVPILFGGRLSGKLDKTWKVGLMNVQTREDAVEEMRGQNYLVALIQKSLFSGSSLTAFVSNRQLVQDFELDQQDYTRIGGLEFDYRSADSKLTGKAFAHWSSNPNPQAGAQPLAWSSKVRYRTKTFSAFAGIDAVGEDYLPDMGFVPRLYHSDEARDTSIRVAYLETRVHAYYRFFPRRSTTVDFWGSEVKLQVYTTPRFRYQEHKVRWEWHLRWLNQGQLSLGVIDFSQLLLFPFQLDGLNKAFPQATYHNRRLKVRYESGKRNAFYGSAEANYGGTFTGRKLELSGALNYRHFQFLVLGIDYNYQKLHRFPSPFGSADFSLLGAKVEWSLNRSLFLTAFLQYNTQRQNFNINGRFNWRFHPLSDLFIVYTSNYATTDFRQDNRALVFKLNYWLNL